MRSLESFRRGALLAAAVVVFLLLGGAGAGRASVLGSKHDFVGKNIDKGGVCTPCHNPHFAPYGPGGWPRDMSAETLFFRQGPPIVVGDPGQLGYPDYRPSPTLLCYDCHDDAAITLDNDPVKASSFTNPPQDTALGGGAAKLGYYETACRQVPGGANVAPSDGSPTGGHYWKTEPVDNPDTRRVGDKIACKLCHDPHNTDTRMIPTDTPNEVFFRAKTWDGTKVEPIDKYGTGLLRSPNSLNAAGTPGTGTGREMCASCHRYAGETDQETFYNVKVPAPPVDALVPEHNSGNTVPCTDCHGHNSIAGCNDCHGFPPLLATPFNRLTNPNGQSYPGGAGAHRRHLDALGTAIFKCEICHGPNPGRPVQRKSPDVVWHNQTAGATCNTVSQANVDIIGQTAYWGAGSGFNGVATGGFTEAGVVYAFAAKGGPDLPALSGRCSNLTCHGNPPASTGTVFLNWTDKLVDDATGDIVGDGLSICKWCHDATPARIGAGPRAPNVLGTDDGSTGSWSTATNFWGADVNGHGKAAGFYDDNQVGTPGALPGANFQCAVCHDARYTTLPLPALNTPIKPHFVPANNDEKRLKGTNGTTINGVAVADPDGACNACHQNGAPVPLPGSYYGKFVSTHGNNFPDKSLPGPDFTRSCRQCHNVHGANWNGLSGAAPNLGRNLHMVGAWVDSDNDGVTDPGEEARVDSNAIDASANITAADLAVVFTTNSGENSYDDGFGGPEAPARHESVCVVCHVSLAAVHGPDNMVGSLRTRADANTHNPIGGDCMECHKHNNDTDVLTADGFAPSGCYGCHGTNDTETLAVGAVRRQFWPDGSPRTGLPAQFVYSDNQAGAHKTHVAALAADLYGETEAQLVTDTGNGLSVDKQKAVCAFCHRDPGGPGHSTNVNNDPLVDRANVFGDTDDTAGAGALDVFKRLAVGPGAFATDLSGVNGDQAYTFGTQSCANLVCHNRAATPVAPTGWNAPPVWTLGINSKCSNTTCHATTTYPVGEPHYEHVAATQKNYECLQCHANNGVNLAHGNGEVDMQNGAAPWVWNNPATVEGSAFGSGNGYYDKDKSGGPSAGDTAFAYKNGVYDATCNLIYCHGDDNAAGQLPPADRGTNTRPQWGFPATAACGTCHKTTAADPPGTLSHPTHAGSAAGQYSLGCQVCHYPTTQDGTTIASMALHVNTSVEVNPFNALADGRVAASSSYGGDTVMGSGYGSCSFTYCHSRGNDTATPFNDVPLSVPIAAPLVWGASATCSSCHGNPGALPTVDPSMPDYAHLAPKANRHAIHSTTNDVACQICHYPTTQDGTTIAGTAAHANGTFTLGPDAAGAALYQFSWTAPNCNATVCHGGNGAITWAGGPYACNVCHGMASGVVTNVDVDDFAWAGATPTMSKISTSEYAADGGGHGDNAGANRPNLACAACHDSAAPHDTTAALSGANPFRMVDQDAGAANVQYSCSNTVLSACHAVGIIGPRTGIDISTFSSHTAAAMGNAGWTTKRTWPAWTVAGTGTGLGCANCHDPHGDGNLSMVNRRIYDKGSFPLPSPAPVQPTEQLTLTFTDGSTGLGPGSYANTADYSGICQECHEGGGIVSFHDGPAGGTASGANHPIPASNPGDCSNCHMHDKGFSPMACKPCHEPPTYGGIPGGDAAPAIAFFDVNGHGTKTVDPACLGKPGPVRPIECDDCHQIGSPIPSTHLTGTFETYAYPGSPWGGPNTNTSHLETLFFGTVVAERDWQLNFDRTCYNNACCHGTTPAKGHRHEMTHKDGVIRFGDHTTVANPKAVRSLPYWTPWTMNDISADAPPPAREYGPCISCHDPHGVDPGGFPYCNLRADGNLHMVKKDWCDQTYFCNSNCHNP